MTDAATSTRTVADVKRHRLERVAAHLRTFADRIESGDVDVARLDFHRELEDITPDNADWEEHRAQRGSGDDEVVTIALQLVPYCPCNLRTEAEGEPASWALKSDDHVCTLDEEGSS